MKRDETAVLRERRSLAPDAFLLSFESPTLSEAFVPGQFTMVRVPGREPLLRRPYSLCAAQPGANRFSLLVKVVGEGSRALAELTLGSEIECLGPLGSFFEQPGPEEQAVVVAGGVGIAPFVGFCQKLERSGRRGTVLLGGRREPDLYLKEEFQSLGMEVLCSTEDGSFGHRGLVTELLPKVLSEKGPYRLYSCGPTGMLVRTAEVARERGIAHQVSIERRMGCGMGCCWGCVVHTRRGGEDQGEYRRTCTDGPVFDADEISWDRDPHPL